MAQHTCTDCGKPIGYLGTCPDCLVKNQPVPQKLVGDIKKNGGKRK